MDALSSSDTSGASGWSAPARSNIKYSGGKQVVWIVQIRRSWEEPSCQDIMWVVNISKTTIISKVYMCTIIIIITMCGSRRWRVVLLLQPARLPNGQPETKMHHQEIFPGVSAGKEGDQNQLLFTGGWTISICLKKRVFWAKPQSSPELNQVAFGV